MINAKNHDSIPLYHTLLSANVRSNINKVFFFFKKKRTKKRRKRIIEIATLAV
jgi:hypothetical protein